MFVRLWYILCTHLKYKGRWNSVSVTNEPLREHLHLVRTYDVRADVQQFGELALVYSGGERSVTITVAE